MAIIESLSSVLNPRVSFNKSSGFGNKQNTALYQSDMVGDINQTGLNECQRVRVRKQVKTR